MLNKIILAVAVSMVSLPALAKPDLPFNGTRHFNFMGGSGTGQSIHIDNKGLTTIKLHGTTSTGILYKGPYQKNMPLDDGGYYGIIGKDTITMLDKNGNQEYGCSADETLPCTQKLY